MPKPSNILKDKIQRISTGISSGNIIDLNEFRSTNYFGIIKCFFKNKMIMNQTETVFLDFKRKEFPVTARNHYHKVFEAFKKKDKIDLMNLLSIPMFDLFKACIKEKKDLPFYLYPEVLDVKIMQARIYSLHKHNLNPSQTWHQLTMEFICKDLDTKNEIKQYSVFERREADTSAKDWRLCHIE